MMTLRSRVHRLFGTARVIRPHVAKKRCTDHRELDTTEHAPHPYYERAAALSTLSPSSLVLFALINGGDYSDPVPMTFTKSAPGPAKTLRDRRHELALRLARDKLSDGRSFADALVEPLVTVDDLDRHIGAWLTHFRAHAGLPSYAVHIPALPHDFPTRDALLLYARPLVSTSAHLFAHLPRWGMSPAVAELRRQAARYLGWTDDAAFHDRLGPALAANLVRKLALAHQPAAYPAHRATAFAAEGRIVRELLRTERTVRLEVDLDLDEGRKLTTRVWVSAVLADFALLSTLVPRDAMNVGV
jgi:hypothetical protein